MTVELAAGLATYLSEAWGREVVVGELSTATAGARRQNVLFEATADGETRRLVATIVPPGETILNEIDAEAAVRSVAEQGGVVVPHVHLCRTDGELVGGPFMVSDFVAGETVPRRVLRLVAEQGIGDVVAEQLGESLGRLHAIDPAEVSVPLRELDADDPTGAALRCPDGSTRSTPAAPPGTRARAALARAPPATPAGPCVDRAHRRAQRQRDRRPRWAACGPRLGGRAGSRRSDAGRGVAGAADVALPGGPPRDRRVRWSRPVRGRL